MYLKKHIIDWNMFYLCFLMGKLTAYRKNYDKHPDGESNARIQQLVTLLYMHKTMVESDGIIQSESEELQKIIKRIDRNYGYYSTNPMIKGTFDFLKLVVDNWFKTV